MLSEIYCYLQVLHSMGDEEQLGDDILYFRELDFSKKREEHCEKIEHTQVLVWR